jgi:hypothetical protein
MRYERAKEVRERARGRERMRAAAAEAYSLVPGRWSAGNGNNRKGPGRRRRGDLEKGTGSSAQ